MSYRNLSYSEYPGTPPNGPEVPLQSPSVANSGYHSIKTRLSFSPAQVPAPKRSLINHRNFGHPSDGSVKSSPAASSPLNRSRIREYHRSRQNPDILDEMYTPPLASRGAGFGKETAGNVMGNRQPGQTSGSLWGSNDYSRSPRLGGTGSLSHNSHLLRVLKHRSHGSSPNSLVQLAAKKNAGRLLRNGIGRSPVTVKLAGVKEENQPMEVKETGSGERKDPCDKEVVLSALRQKRKRWASTAPEDGSGPGLSMSPAVISPPMSKRSRKEKLVLHNEPPSAVVDRKRGSTATTLSAVKRSKVDDRGPTNILSLSDIELDEEGDWMENGGGVSHPTTRTETVPTIPVRTANGISCGRVSRGSTPPSGRVSKGATPPILMDEAEINRKRDESLGILKAVFTSPLETEKKDSLRRKLPIFCATGMKPHLPSPLSATHSVTQEDLKKDREAIAARLKAFLEADDEPDGAVTTSTSSAKSVSNGVGVVSTASTGLKLTSVGVTAAPSLPSLTLSTTQTAAPVSLPAQLPAQLPARLPSEVPHGTISGVSKSASTKTVSFAPLPNLTVNQQSTSTSLATGSSLQVTATTAVSTGVSSLSGSLSGQQKATPGLSKNGGILFQTTPSTTVATTFVASGQQASGPALVPTIGTSSSTQPATLQPTQSMSAPLHSTAPSAPLVNFGLPSQTSVSQAGPTSTPSLSMQAPRHNPTTGLLTTQQAFTPLTISQNSASQTPKLPVFTLPKTTQSSLSNQGTLLSGLLNQSSQPKPTPQFSLNAQPTPILGGQNAQPSIPQSSLFNQGMQPATQTSILQQSTPQPSLFNNTQSSLSSQAAQLAPTEVPKSSQPIAFNFNASQDKSASASPAPNLFGGLKTSGGDTLFGGLKTSTATGTTGPSLFGGLKTSVAAGSTPILFGGQKTLQTTGGGATTGPNLFGGLKTSGATSGASLFGQQQAPVVAGGNAQGGINFFGRLKSGTAAGGVGSQGTSVTASGGQGTLGSSLFQTSGTAGGQGTLGSSLFVGQQTSATASGGQGTLGSSLFVGQQTSATASGGQGTLGSSLFQTSGTAGGQGTLGSSLFGGKQTSGTASGGQGTLGSSLFVGQQTSGTASGGQGSLGSSIFGGQTAGTAPGASGPGLFGGLKANSNASQAGGTIFGGGLQTAGGSGQGSGSGGTSTIFGSAAPASGSGFQFSATSTNKQTLNGGGTLGTGPLQNNALNFPAQNTNIFNPKGPNPLIMGQPNPLTKPAAGGGGAFQPNAFQFGVGQQNKTFEFGGGGAQQQPMFGAGGSQPQQNMFAGAGSQPVMFQAGSSTGQSTPRKTVRGRRKKK